MVAKSVILFIDGQNLFRRAMDAWNSPCTTCYCYPSYDVEKLSYALTNRIENRVIKQIRFYTGIPAPQSGHNKSQFWHTFWTNKLRYLKNKGVYTYRGRVSQASQEKGVDVSIAVDLIRLTYEKQYDVAIIISQDWDYGPAVKLAKLVAKEQGRRLDFESCFPYEPHISADRGIPGTMWIKIDKALYDSCLDSRDYRYTP